MSNNITKMINLLKLILNTRMSFLAKLTKEVVNNVMELISTLPLSEYEILEILHEIQWEKIKIDLIEDNKKTCISKLGMEGFKNQFRKYGISYWKKTVDILVKELIEYKTKHKIPFVDKRLTIDLFEKIQRYVDNQMSVYIKQEIDKYDSKFNNDFLYEVHLIYRKILIDVVTLDTKNCRLPKQERYDNLVMKLSIFGIEVVTEIDDWKNTTTKIIVKCFDGHTKEESGTNIINKINLGQEICNECEKNGKVIAFERRTLLKLAKDLCKNSSIIILGLENSKIKYKCLDCEINYELNKENLSRDNIQCKECKTIFSIDHFENPHPLLIKWWKEDIDNGIINGKKYIEEKLKPLLKTNKEIKIISNEKGNHSKYCLKINCEKYAMYGFNIRKYCSEHKEKGMIDLVNKLCEVCGKTACFGIPGEKVTRCKKHIKEGMEDLTHGKCKSKGCKKQAAYGLKSGKREYCILHKSKDMIDLANNKCTEECKNRASFGLPGNKATVCGIHKKIGYIHDPNKSCKFTNAKGKCKNLALYGYSKAIHCEDHKLDDENDMICKICKECGLPMVVDKNGICEYHDINKLNKSYCQKQKKVMKYLSDNLDWKIHSYDKIIDSKCNKKRPDITFDAITHFVIVEIDENQHSSYTEECENTRMKEICQSFGTPCIFIRYNPDEYITDGKKFDEDTDKRLKKLCSVLKELLKRKPKDISEFLRVTYLFFNDWNGKEVIKNIKLPNGF